MEKLTVVQVTTVPFAGGAEHLVRELVQRLPGHGMETRGIYFSVLEGLGNRSAGLKLNEHLLGYSSQRNPLVAISLRSYIKKLLDEGKQVVVHAHLSWPLYYTAFAVRGLGISGLDVPMVYTEHNTYTRRRSLPLLNLLEKRVMRRYDQIVCISDGAERSLKEWIGRRKAPPIRVIENGARRFPFHEREKPDKNGLKLLSVGSLSRQKGFDIFLKALAELKEVVREYVIIGEGSERSKLEELVRDYGLEQVVRLKGWVDDVEAYYQSADFLIIPSRWEGFGLVAVEGMSTGLPVVANDVDGLRHTVGAGHRGALFVEENNTGAWVRAVRNVNDRLDSYKEMSRAAAAQSDRFSLDEMTARYADLYREVCGGNVR